MTQECDMVEHCLDGSFAAPVQTVESIALQTLVDSQLVQSVYKHVKHRVILARGAVVNLRQFTLNALEDGEHATHIRNVAFALQERLAYSPFGFLSTGALGPANDAHAGKKEPWLARDWPGSSPSTTCGLVGSTALAARRAWQQLLLQRLESVQVLLQLPLASPCRNLSEIECLLGNGSPSDVVGASASALSCHDPPLRSTKLLYDADDLLAFITDTRAGLGAGSSETVHAIAVQERPDLPPLLHGVSSLTRTWLQSFFAEMRPDKRQVGVDDELYPWYAAQQRELARRVLRGGAVAGARELCRGGVPASARPAVWRSALGLTGRGAAVPGGGHVQGDNSGSGDGGVEGGRPAGAFSISGTAAGGSGGVSAGGDGTGDAPSPAGLSFLCADEGVAAAGEQEFQALCCAVVQQSVLADVLVRADVKALAGDSQFFLFEETLRCVLLAMSRDASVAAHCSLRPFPRLEGVGAYGDVLSPYPLSGVVPFHGMAAFAAPLCYLYRSPAAVFHMFRAMYCRHWCRLHVLADTPPPQLSLLGLCRVATDLLQELDPEVVAHLCQLGCSPVRVMLPWLACGFARQLSVGQTLLLWDRVVGHDSLLPLALLAAAVLSFRREMVLASHDVEDLMDMMGQLSALQVVPLMQAALFDS